MYAAFFASTFEDAMESIDTTVKIITIMEKMEKNFFVLSIAIFFDYALSLIMLYYRLFNIIKNITKPIIASATTIINPTRRSGWKEGELFLFVFVLLLLSLLLPFALL